MLICDSVTNRKDNKAVEILLKYAKTSDKLHIKTLGRTHHKIAIIDKKTIIFSSANLQKNQTQEFYMMGDFDKVDGAEDILKYFKTAGDFKDARR